MPQSLLVPQTHDGLPDTYEVMQGTDTERRRRFDALFAAHREDIVSYCTWRTRSPSDAHDAAADVFLTAWRRLEELPDGDAARIWLYAAGVLSARSP